MSVGQSEPTAGKHILIAHFDLFKDVGGGQSVYKSLIASRPNDVFYYFRRDEAQDSPRPANAVGIPYANVFPGTPDGLPANVVHFFYTYLECRNMAFAAARHCPGVAFDVVDVPDYSQNGLFVTQTLRAEGIDVGLTALALHGTLSQAFRGGWPIADSQARMQAELRVRERLQFRTADVRYAISDMYARQWRRIIPLPVNRLDPLCVVDSGPPTLADSSAEPPDLAFVGRREKWKGPDLFLDFAWCLDPSLYRRLIVAGPDGPNYRGTGSMEFLPRIAGLRRLKPEIVDNLDADQLRALHADRTVLLLPSRHDTFNLVALEAVLRGCPIHVSNRAGVAEWLAASLPELPWLMVDVGCARTAAATTAETLRDYDRRRGELVEALTRRPPRADMSTIQTIYDNGAEIDIAARQTMAEMAARFATLVRFTEPSSVDTIVARSLGSVRQLVDWFKPALPPPMRAMGKSMRSLMPAKQEVRPRRGIRERLKTHIKTATGLSPRAIRQITTTRGCEAHRHHLLTSNEARVLDMRARLRDLSSKVPTHLVNRIPLFLELARLERRSGNELTAATYMLRIMRWMGHDAYGTLPFVAATLRTHHFTHEADAAEAMFGPEEHTERRCFELVQAAYDRNRRNPDRPLAILDDRRGNEKARVAVIASLYNAADKLPTLLAMLARQTVALSGDLEVVLVDSNSPADEHGAMTRFLKDQPLSVVFARSEQRETIQAAWNRGINLARAPYLCFLGVDEGLHPEALHILAGKLDADPTLDWAMADSLVTNVDRDGVYDSDIMPYDRSGYGQDLVYLETCYLSWVGGLYRRSIHDRFGYYDESFRASGDTEFKNRILPHIRSVHVPKMLGVFNNYPEERTTQSPRAEIEDLRAWYLWRTPGGLRYAFDNRPAEDAASLLRTALNYRKSFCGHLSSDFDIANALAVYLSGRPDAPSWVPEARREIAAALRLLRSIELVPPGLGAGHHGLGIMWWAYQRVCEARRLGARHQRLLNLPATPVYEVFNDNRHEQHWWSWSG